MPHNVNTDAARVMTICNACRYCEGYCAVFPAMERRTVFDKGDLAYLANLCHNCAECYYACPYTPPHEFAVNVPKLLAAQRAQSYRENARPRWYGGGILVAILVSVVAMFWGAWRTPQPGFYGVIPHRAMVELFGAAGAFVFVMLGASLMRFWRQSGSGAPQLRSVATALRDAMSLRYLSGGTPGAQARRWFHHCTFYGFLLCFASTTTAAFDHYLLGLRAPYPWSSAPVLLGALGGIGLLIGPVGLFALRRVRDPEIMDLAQNGPEISFLAALALTSFTGLLLLVLRDTHAMPVLLRVHLGVVLALFLTMPYGKFVHGTYRFAALARYAFEAASSEARNVL